MSCRISRLLSMKEQHWAYTSNRTKTELMCMEPAGKQILVAAPDLCKVNPKDTVLLGFLIGQDSSIDDAITNKVDTSKIKGTRLCHLSKHDALLSLCHSVDIPKVLYILRTVPCFWSLCLKDFNHELCSILGTVLNINWDNNSAWVQATLPGRYGGIGVHRATQLASSTFWPLLLVAHPSCIS